MFIKPSYQLSVTAHGLLDRYLVHLTNVAFPTVFLRHWKGVHLVKISVQYSLEVKLSILEVVQAEGIMCVCVVIFHCSVYN